MCRTNQLLGVSLLAFGAGLLAAGWVESNFLRWVLGIGLAASGILVLKKN